jgi:hypothetical protein
MDLVVDIVVARMVAVPANRNASRRANTSQGGGREAKWSADAADRQATASVTGPEAMMKEPIRISFVAADLHRRSPRRTVSAWLGCLFRPLHRWATDPLDR